jgi:hypothetical protein
MARAWCYGGEYDFVKILDFGLVKLMSGQHSRDLARSLPILGTPLYGAGTAAQPGRCRWRRSRFLWSSIWL